MHHPLADLQRARHAQQACLPHHARLPGRDGRPHHQVQETRLVFQRHEGDARRRLRPLPGRNDASHLHPRAVVHLRQTVCRAHPEALQMLAKQGQRVATQAEPHAVVIGDDVLGFRRLWQQQRHLRPGVRPGRCLCGCSLGSRKQWQFFLVARHVPEGPVPVIRQCPQGIGGRQALAVTPVDARALHQRLHTAERSRLTRLTDTPCSLG
jgi:hypothetical protein